MKSSTVQKITLLVLAVLTVWYSFYLIQPPASKPADSPPTAFSAQRAFRHVQQIATKPHPLGSAANDSVQSYLIKQLRKMELQPAMLEGVGVSKSFRQGLAGYAKDIFARIDGSNPTKTILLMAHYDSVPTGPGAADDASSVAAILETIRAIKERAKPLKNNVWILFTDGEERGLLGAELFADEFADLDKIDLVLNFEARGSSGPSMMFETSTPNGDLIPDFAKATSHPVANSLMYTVYKMLPNDTDLSVTKRVGLHGINFAFAEQLLNYHTMQDNPQSLSLASLQHQGSNLLSNLLYFGNTDFNLNSKSEYVYFNNAAGGLTYYPAGWSLPLAIIAAILFIAYLVFLFRTRQLTIGKYLGSLGIFLGMLVLGTAISFFGWKGFSALHPEYQWLLMGENYSHSWYLWGFILLNLGIFCGVYGWIQTKLSTQQLLSGSFTIWILLSLMTAWYLPTASYILTWPVLMALIGWIVLGKEITTSSWKSTLILFVSISGALFLVPPYIFLIQVMLTTRMIAVSMLLVLLTLGLCWALIWQIIRNRKGWWTAGLLLGAAACLLTASVNSGFDSRHKKGNDISYVQDLNHNRAYWVSRDFKPDSWTAQFLGSDFKQDTLSNIRFFGKHSVLYHPAQPLTMPTPTIELLADSISDTMHFMRLQIHPNQSGIGMQVGWDNTVPIKDISIEDKQIYGNSKPINDHPESFHRISYFQNLSEPIEMTVVLSRKQNAFLFFDFVKSELPIQLIPNYKQRSPDMMPAPHPVTNSTIREYAVSLDTLSVKN